MHGLVKLMMVAAACTALAGCWRVQEAGEFAGVVHPTVLAKADLQYFWNMEVDLDPGERICELFRLDENLYFLSDRNRLIAVDARIGAPKWSYVVADAGQPVFRPVHVDRLFLSKKPVGIAEMLQPALSPKMAPFDAVLINTLSYALVLNRSDGTLVRKIDFEFPANVGGTCDGAMFYVGSTQGRYYAISMAEGIQTWAMSAGDMISVPIALFGKEIFVASRGGALQSSQAGKARLLMWKQELDGPITAAFHVDERGCFVPCDDGRLYAFDAIAGRKLWDPFLCQGPLRDPVQVAQNTIFQFARGDRFYAINLVNGSRRWDMPEGRLVLGVMNGVVYVLDNTRTLRVVDEMLGKVQTAVPMTGFDLFLGNTTAPAIYTATADGHLFCIRPISAGHLTTAMLRKEAPKAAPGEEPGKGPATAPALKPPKPTPKPPKKTTKPAEEGAAETPAETPAKTPAKKAPKKPAEEKPAEEKPAEEKPAEEKPAEEKPAEEKP